MKGSSVIGRVIPMPQGTWDINKQYKKLDIVYAEIQDGNEVTHGKSYIAKRDVPAIIDINNTEYWQVLAEGTPGPQGEGIKGDTGPTGNVYYPMFNVDLTNGMLYAVHYDDGPTFSISTSGDLIIELK